MLASAGEERYSWGRTVSLQGTDDPPPNRVRRLRISDPSSLDSVNRGLPDYSDNLDSSKHPRTEFGGYGSAIPVASILRIGDCRTTAITPISSTHPRTEFGGYQSAIPVATILRIGDCRTTAITLISSKHPRTEFEGYQSAIPVASILRIGDCRNTAITLIPASTPEQSSEATNQRSQ